jgi:2-methylisocitrate lyase-like PEP mutase family enzyme
MDTNKASQLPAIAKFRAMHESGCFVLPNPWDVGTAVYLQQLGFQALATTSAGVAFSRGLPDATPAFPLEDMLAHIREIVVATSLPVNADFQKGYADDPGGVAANVIRCIATGVAGLSIEDNTGRSAAPLTKKARRSSASGLRAARSILREFQLC